MKEKKLKRFDPFGTCLEQAIQDEANPVLGMTPAKEELFLRMAGMVETQADRPDRDFYTATDIRFGRLNREERVAYLDEHRKALLDGPEVIFFDTELHYLNRDLEQKEKLAQAIGMNVKPTEELLTVWRECNHNAREFVQRTPYLKQLLDGLVAALKLGFIERELRCYNTPFSPKQIKRLQAIEFIDAQTDERRTFTMEEISQMGLITLTYEDWLSGRYGPYTQGDLFEPLPHTDGGITTLRVHALSQFEYRKIQVKKEEVLEGYVSAYTNALIEEFEGRYRKAPDKIKLVQSRLEKVDELLSNPKSDVIYSVYTTALQFSFRNDRRTDETVCHWYKRICVDGDDAMDAIAPMHVNIKAQNLPDSGSTKYVVAALAFQRFKSFLEHRLKNDKHLSENKPELNENARAYLAIFSGRNVYGRKIMSDNDYRRLEGYVEAMVAENGLPPDLEPIGQIDLQNSHIRYLFYCMHKAQHTTKQIQGYFIDFIHAVFLQFTGEPVTTQKKFSEKPPDWDNDYERMKGG